MPIVKRFAFVLLALFGFATLGVATSGGNAGSGFLISAAQADDDDDDGQRAKRRTYNPNVQRPRYQGQGAYRGRYRDDDDDDGAKNRRQYRGKQYRNDDDD